MRNDYNGGNVQNGFREISTYNFRLHISLLKHVLIQ